MAGQKAVVIGATGLIGQQLIKQLADDPAFDEVTLLLRRQIHFDDPKLKPVVVDFNDVNNLVQNFGEGDSIFSCVGTTRSKVKGDQAEYRKVDYDIPLNAARIGISKGFKKFLLVSSIGADRFANNSYLRLKGEIEKDLQEINFYYLGVFRPSLLMGDRKEFRAMEKFVQGIFPAVSALLPKKYSKYHSIYAAEVAAAMISASKQDLQGIHVYEYENMMKLNKRF